MNAGEIVHIDGVMHRVLVPFGGWRRDVLAIFLRLTDGKRLIFWPDGRLVEVAG